MQFPLGHAGRLGTSIGSLMRLGQSCTTVKTTKSSGFTSFTLLLYAMAKAQPLYISSNREDKVNDDGAALDDRDWIELD
jgi:hypothetical protein